MTSSVTNQQITSQTRGIGGTLALFYGMLCYLVFLGTFLYAIGFVENLIVPKSIDSGPVTAFGPSLLVDLLLLGRSLSPPFQREREKRQIHHARGIAANLIPACPPHRILGPSRFTPGVVALERRLTARAGCRPPAG